MSETGGQGRGIWQIDIGQHPDAATFASLPDQSQAANYAAGLLRTDYNIFERRFGGNTDTLTAYAVRAYNGGRINLLFKLQRVWEFLRRTAQSTMVQRGTTTLAMCWVL